jgi:hypothetical protein
MGHGQDVRDGRAGRVTEETGTFMETPSPWDWAGNWLLMYCQGCAA